MRQRCRLLEKAAPYSRPHILILGLTRPVTRYLETLRDLVKSLRSLYYG